MATIAMAPIDKEPLRGGRLAQISVAILCVLLLDIPLHPVVAMVFAVAVALSTTFGQVETGAVYLDYGVLFFYTSSCISTAFAYDVATALPQLTLRTVCTLIYLACRRRELISDLVCAVLAVGIIIYCAESLRHFVPAYVKWQSLHFASLVDFRSSIVLTANGAKPGDHAAAYVLATTVMVHRMVVSRRELVKFISLLAAAMSIACMLLSFSRGLYLALAVLLATAIYSLRRSTVLSVNASSAVLYCLLIFALAAAFFRPIGCAIVETALMVSRPSQIASANGRLAILRTGYSLALHAGVSGTGLSNYALTLRRSHLAAAHPTAHPLNLVLQIIVEQGYLGLLTLVCAASSLLIVVINRNRGFQRFALLGGYSALVIYGLTQDYVVADQPTAALLAVYCAIVANGRGTNG
jgi:O-Antigen ligase